MGCIFHWRTNFCKEVAFISQFPRFRTLLDRQIRHWLYPGLFTLVFLLSGLWLPHLAYGLSSETVCQNELNGNSIGNRSMEILEQCRNQNPIPSVDRGEIQRRLALMYYDRLGATGRDRLGTLPRSQKIEALESQVNDSIEMAIIAGDDVLLSRYNYTLGQIWMNEIDRSVRLLDKTSTSEMIAFQTQIQHGLEPLLSSNQIQSRLYQARLLTIALPILYRAVDRQTQELADSSESNPSEASVTLDRLSQQTQRWTMNLLQLLPQIQSQIQPQSSAQLPSSESVALAIYHAHTLSKLQSVRVAANQLETRRQTAEMAMRKALKSTQTPTAKI